MAVASGVGPYYDRKANCAKNEVLNRLGIRKTTLHETFIKTGRLRFVKIGVRSVGIIEDELDALIEDDRSAIESHDRSRPLAVARESRLGSRK